MEANKTKNAARNIAWGIIQKILISFFPFVTRTIIIRTLGIEYLGLSSVFTSVLQILSLAELGISEAIIFSMYTPLAERDTDKLCALLNFYRTAYRIIGAVILTVGLGLMFKLDVLIKGEYPADINLRILYLIYLINTVSGYFMFSYLNVVLVVNQRNDVTYKIVSAIAIIKNLFQILLLLLYKNYYYFALMIPATTIIGDLITAHYVKKNYPEMRCTGELDAALRKSLKKQVSGLVIGKLTTVSRNAFDTVVLSSMIGLVDAAIYGNYYYLLNFVYGFIVSMAVAIRGAIGNDIATKSPHDNYRDMLKFLTMFWWIYGICSVTLLCVYQPFMQLWTRGRSVAEMAVPVLMSIYLYLQCSFVIFSQYVEAAGLFWENRYRFITEAASNLVLNIVLVKLLGMPGIILATIVSMLLLTNIMGPLIGFKKYFVDEDRQVYFKEQIHHLLIIFFAGGIALFLCSLIKAEGIAAIIINAAIAVLCTFTAIVGFTFKTERFKEAYKYSLRVVKTIVGNKLRKS